MIINTGDRQVVVGEEMLDRRQVVRGGGADDNIHDFEHNKNGPSPPLRGPSPAGRGWLEEPGEGHGLR